MSVDETTRNASCKGKHRAEVPTEHTPLLPSTSTQYSSYTDNETHTPNQRSPSLRARLTFVFVSSLSLCISVFVILGLLAYSYAPQGSDASVDAIIKNAVVFRGPDRVDVLNVTASGDVWVALDMRIGVDAGSVIGVKRGSEDGMLVGVWKCLGRWGIRRLERVSVDVETVNVTSTYGPTFLASVVSQPLVLPLTPDAPPDDVSWLTNISTVFLVRPTKNTSALVEFMRGSWRRGAIEVEVDVRRASVTGGGINEKSWRRRLQGVFLNIRQSVRLRIPPLPGLPRPGDNAPFPSVAELVTLKSFNVSSGSNQLNLRATATLIDPAPPTFNLTSPSFPFTVSLPPANGSTSPLDIASVSTAPFSLTHPNITLDISGKVLPLSHASSSALSSFASRYLSRRSNPILIASPWVPGLYIDAVFPAPDPPPRLLRDVTIRDMRIKPGATLLASGTIIARIVLPIGVNVQLNVSKVLPDVLVFDGEVPEDVPYFGMTPGPEPAPLPDPLPERAFGRIRPDEWVNASSVLAAPEKGEGKAYVVTAKIVDVPLEVLHGRQKEFSSFVGKVIFGSGATAGIWGSAAVSLKIRGLPVSGTDGEVELSGLPFRGSVPVRKKSMLSGHWTWPT